MQLRIKHNLGLMSVVFVFAPTEMCDMKEKMPYAVLESTLDQYSHRDGLDVFGNFSAITGTDRAAYEMWIGHHGFGTRNNNNSLFLNLASSRRL